MAKLPILKSREVIGILEKLGRDISPVLLRRIVTDIGLDPEEFVKHL